MTQRAFPVGPGPQVGQRITVNPCSLGPAGIRTVGQATTVQILLQLGMVPSAANQAAVSINPTGVVTVNNVTVRGASGNVTLEALLPN